jgi:hypothetical protein
VQQSSLRSTKRQLAAVFAVTQKKVGEQAWDLPQLDANDSFMSPSFFVATNLKGFIRL